MRCYCCNNILTTKEACTTFKGSNKPTEMCTPCLESIDAEVIIPNRFQKAYVDDDVDWHMDDEYFEFLMDDDDE